MSLHLKYWKVPRVSYPNRGALLSLEEKGKADPAKREKIFPHNGIGYIAQKQTNE